MGWKVKGLRVYHLLDTEALQISKTNLHESITYKKLGNPA